jgi:diguanylate cyclase (GGDEF)-like protein
MRIKGFRRGAVFFGAQDSTRAADFRSTSCHYFQYSMTNSKVSAYLDSGSITLFARQVTEALGNVISVAIHDSHGNLAWAGPDPTQKELWTVNPFLRKKLPGPGFCERLSNRNFAYVFYLNCESDENIGTLSIQLDASNPTSYEFAHAEIKPILQCIERQLEINAELSSVRRMTSEGQKGLDLLVRLDQLDTCAGPHDILRSVLQLTADHFSAGLTAVVIPKLGIQEVHPRALLSDASTSREIMSTLGGLVTAAKMHRQVLLSTVSIKLRIAAGLASDSSKVLCSPIINSKDQIVGIFVLMGPDEFRKEQIRLIRAVCAKVNTLTRTADQLSSEHYSRHGLLQHISGIVARNPDASHALLYLDIDKLHVVNDSFGHMAGDQVIRAVNRIVAESAGKDDAVSHLSGDRMGLFVRDCSEKKALEKAALILESINRERVEYDGKSIDLAASIGVALIPDVVSDASAALNTAEVAARSAKERGGNRVVVFQDIDASVAQRRSDLDQVNHLQMALIQNRFALYAQPIVALKEEERGYRFEILVRMLDEEDGLIPPDKFMSAAERYQMMSALDRWVVKNTLAQISNSDNALEVNLASFSINVSAQSLSDDDFLEFLEARIAESGVSPDSLCFEITETTVVRNLERAQRFIRRLRRLGCRLALDDFGTGYCSFAYLKDMPVQYIKVDGVFVRDLLENPLSEAIISSMVKISEVMKCFTVAEHVESDLVLQRLRQYGIDYVQGFRVGRPKPLLEVLQDMGPPVMVDSASDAGKATG